MSVIEALQSNGINAEIPAAAAQAVERYRAARAKLEGERYRADREAEELSTLTKTLNDDVTAAFEAARTDHPTLRSIRQAIGRCRSTITEAQQVDGPNAAEEAAAANGLQLLGLVDDTDVDEMMSLLEDARRRGSEREYDVITRASLAKLSRALQAARRARGNVVGLSKDEQDLRAAHAKVTAIRDGWLATKPAAAAAARIEELEAERMAVLRRLETSERFYRRDLGLPEAEAAAPAGVVVTTRGRHWQQQG